MKQPTNPSSVQNQPTNCLVLTKYFSGMCISYTTTSMKTYQNTSFNHGVFFGICRTLNWNCNIVVKIVSLIFPEPYFWFSFNDKTSTVLFFFLIQYRLPQVLTTDNLPSHTLSQKPNMNHTVGEHFFSSKDSDVCSSKQSRPNIGFCKAGWTKSPKLLTVEEYCSEEYYL